MDELFNNAIIDEAFVDDIETGINQELLADDGYGEAIDTLMQGKKIEDVEDVFDEE